MGIDIPVDLEIAIDVLSLHYDPEIWGPEDPNVFCPQRFVCLNTTLNEILSKKVFLQTFQI
jgi:hypothetical protein